MERTRGCRRRFPQRTLCDLERVRFIGASGSHTTSGSRSETGTNFPAQYISEAGRVVGQPLTLDELLAGMPRTTGLFTAPPAPTTPQTVPATPAAPVTPAAATAAQPSGAEAPRGAGLQPQNTPGSIGTSGTVQPVGPYQYPDQNQLAGALKFGFQPGSYVPGTASIDPASETPRYRIPATTTDAGMGLFNQQGLVNTGIGAPPPTYAAPPSVLGGVNPITAPTVGLTAGDYAALQKGLFEQQYRPVANELERTGAIADRQLQSRLAGAGLASSGAGVGQQQQQVAARQAQEGQLASQAAQQATVQTMAAKMQEQLTNAGFNMQAQQQNAANVLAGNTTNAANYLSTLGLNEQAAQQARSQFLQYLGIQEQDLARMDNQSLQSLSVALNTWLQQYATLGTIGRISESTSTSTGRGGGVNIVSSSGGGGTTTD